jgi:hypothetical protein
LCAGLLIFYYYLFIGLRKYRDVNPESAPGALCCALRRRGK